MTRRRSHHIVAALAVASAAVAWSNAVRAQSPAAPSSVAPPAPYSPSFGDLMTMAVQPRHTKLGLAGAAHNWAYAAYELNELRNAFARIARTIPVYRSANTGALFAAMTREPLGALGAAIDAHDPAKFESGYRKLTAACNACHVSLSHAAIVIRTPVGIAYPDQRLTPKR